VSAFRAGVDVGGTNTDAVVIDDDGLILDRIKLPTTPDPADGIIDALGQVTRGRTISRVSFGTTHALNAILRRQGLRRVALVRLGSPGTDAIPPLAGWPDDLADAVVAGTWIARGGVEIDGRHVAPDPGELANIASAIVRGGVADAIAIVGMFSPLDDAQERDTASLFAEATGLPISIGSRIGGLGLLERENATILNASLGDLVDHLVSGLEAATAGIGEGVRVYLTQNDGTLMTLEHARTAPVLTIGAGPSNSLRGAALLSGRSDVLVIDVGGTSTDVGALVRSFPRESATGVEVGGVQTNFRMPDLVSVPVGGGTIVEADGSLDVDSVGSRLLAEALVFGGSTPTLTDAAVAGGRVTIGDPDLVNVPDALRIALGVADDRVIGAIDRMRLGPADVDLVAVGGGAVLLPDRLPGVARIERPADADVANAVGGALAPVSGEADFVADVAGERRRRELDRAIKLAGERAIAAGARPDALDTIWIEEIPLAYVDRPVSRVRAKVAGPPIDVLP
jgi:N-methylhydantoinase A/oxoprolinase/acetone carboxylase beta subunit